MKYLLTILITFLSCSDPLENHILTIDNDLPVQVKFYVNGEIKLRIEGESLETIELLEGEYDFSITSESFINCRSLSCLSVFPAELGIGAYTTLLFDRDMQALIRIYIIDQLRNDVDFLTVEFKIR